MDETITRNWNTTVTQDDEVFILGDFTMKPATAAHSYLSKLNGRKYFIKGNHDRFVKSFASYADDFVWVKDYYQLNVNGQCFVLFHYPILEWANYYRGSIHLYGHIHNSAVSGKLLEGLKGAAFNVGVDINGFKPVSINEITRKANRI